MRLNEPKHDAIGRLISVWAGLTIANILYAWYKGSSLEQLWDKEYYQSVAIFCACIVLRKYKTEG